MASVTDGSLLSVAQDIVTDFMDNKTTLNEGVMKKASELGLNNDQTQRLIERTNTEAFLRVYPNDTDFDVASPEVILGVKTASITPRRSVPFASDNEEGMFKAASEESASNIAKDYLDPAYQKVVNMVSDEDIFGMDDEFYKEAHDTQYKPVYDSEFKAMWQAMNDVQKTAAELQFEETDREMRFNDAVEDFADYVKQASLDGVKSIAESEHEVLNMYPEASSVVRAIYDEVTTKLASQGVFPDTLTRSPDVMIQKYASESEVTRRFQKIVDIIHEVL